MVSWVWSVPHKQCDWLYDFDDDDDDDDNDDDDDDDDIMGTRCALRAVWLVIGSSRLVGYLFSMMTMRRIFMTMAMMMTVTKTMTSALAMMIKITITITITMAMAMAMMMMISIGLWFPQIIIGDSPASNHWWLPLIPTSLALWQTNQQWRW